MGLDDLAVKVGLKLALGRLRAWADTGRRTGSETMKALDGWKCLIVTVGFIASAVYTLATGHDLSGLIGGAATAMGWGDLAQRAQMFAGIVAPLVLALWAAGSRLVKAVRQYRAGATATEMLSTEGYVKQAVADGTMERMFPPPPGQPERRKLIPAE